MLERYRSRVDSSLTVLADTAHNYCFKGRIFTFSLQISQTGRLFPCIPTLDNPDLIIFANHPNFQTVDFSPFLSEFSRKDDCSRSSSPWTTPIRRHVFFFFKSQISTGYIPLDDEFNMSFSGRKLYDKCMVASRGRSAWPEKLTEAFPLKQWLRVRDSMLVLEYTVCAAVDLPARRRMGFRILSVPADWHNLISGGKAKWAYMLVY